MASFAAACRLSARLTTRQLRQDGAARGLRTSACSMAAQNFTMPALSPTMTEGNIASWKVKEGDSFAAGDVLLEIETDKASMDVEAQDDGIMAKIVQGDGSKGIKVGARIGVLAESGDDLSTLEIPAEETSAKSTPKEDAAKQESKSEPETASQESNPPADAPKSSGPAKKQAYPFLPSVGHIIKEHKLDASAVEKITPTGPNNRLLKGDVLAYIGSISSQLPAKNQSNFKKLGHLDLSNIKAAAPKAASKAAATPAPVKEVVEDLEVALPISMKAVLEVQQRIESTLGVFMPLSTFISRATEVANDHLPRSKSYQPSTDELFNQVLGLNKISTGGVKGHFLPQITALPGTSPSQKLAKKTDIYDILSGGKSLSGGLGTKKAAPGLSPSVNVFSLKVKKDDKKQAEVFLSRVKTVLESEPGRLVL